VFQSRHPEERLIVEKVIQEIAVEIQRMSGTYQGPMPPPPMMRGFDTVVPGLAREIADAAHEERRHRHRSENKALWNDIFMQSGGLILGWRSRADVPLPPRCWPGKARTGVRRSC